MRDCTINIYLFLLLVFFSFSVKSQEIKPYFKQITHNDGLANNIVECIHKDSDGFLWFGTRNGLSRYDGNELITFRHKVGDSTSISGNRITCVQEDRNGNLWVGVLGSGLNLFNRKTEKFKLYSLSNKVKYPESYNVHSIKLLSDSNLWVCSTAGLARYISETDSFAIFSHNPRVNSLNSPTAFDIIRTRKGEYYVTTSADEIQLFDYEKNEFINISYKRTSQLPNNYRKQILEDKDGILWITANLHGFCMYNPVNKESKIISATTERHTSNTLRGDMILSNDGLIWIATDGAGINVYDKYNNKFTYIQSNDNNQSSLFSNYIYSLYIDETNILWVGTNGEGVNYYDAARQKFQLNYRGLADVYYLNNRTVTHIYEDSSENLWISTVEAGLYKVSSDGNIQQYKHDPDNNNSIPGNIVVSICEERPGIILVGFYAVGLASIDIKNEIITRFIPDKKDPNSIGSENIWSILKDSKNRIWLGLMGAGLDLYDPETMSFTSYSPRSNNPDKVNSTNVMSIIEDNDGDLWFGTEGQGINILDNETNKMIVLSADGSKNSISNDVIRTMFLDSKGIIWIGTEGGGLNAYNKKNKEVTVYTIADGLPSDIIESITEDNSGNFWIGTANGLSNFNPQNMKFRNYNKSDGLKGNEFYQNSILTTKDGTILIGGRKGLSCFRPDEIVENTNIPRLAFTQLKILNKKITVGKEINGRIVLDKSIIYTNNIILTHNDKLFSLTFTALSYTLQEKIQYKYMLEGFDKDWTTTRANNRTVSYSNLEAGNYTFKVIASNNDGKWGDNEITMSIKVLPPVWKTIWFRLLIAVVIIVTLFMLFLVFYRYRVRIKERKFEHKQQVQEQKIIKLQKEKLETELNKLTFYILNRNRVLNKQKNRLVVLSLKAKENVKKGIDSIVKKIDKELDEKKDWQYIEPQLDSVYNNFLTHLRQKHEGLTSSEIRVAAYIRMGHSSKEISELMHKTTKAVENDRYRLRKKIGLQTGDSLSNYIMNL